MMEIATGRVRAIFGTAIAMMAFAELVYFVFWGMLFFPEGSWFGKAVWTATCGLVMGTVIAAFTLLWIERRHDRWAALWRATLVVTGVGSYCAWLCSQIDARFDYFGGPEHATVFVWSGILPAALGGFLYGWLLYRPTKSLDLRLYRRRAG